MADRSAPLELVSIPEVARRIPGVGLRTLKAAASSGELRTYRIGGWLRTAWPDDVEAWVRSKRVRPAGTTASATVQLAPDTRSRGGS